jgi:quercetin dioxygenase-like cupin family protein
MALGTCYFDRISKVHEHEFDEYMVCVFEQYIIIMNGEEFVLNVGDELFISKGTIHSGICIPGTRIIYAFGGKRIQNQNDME